MAKETQSVRRLAHASLLAVEKHGRYSNIEIDSALKNADGISDTDRALYTRLVYGVIERRLTLDHIIGKLSSRPLKDIDPGVLISLRLGLYQLIYTDRIPDFAAVSETVDTVPSRSKGFVNGVLRSFLRGGKKYSLPLGDSPEDLSVRYSVSPEICAIYTGSYGADVTKQILESFFEPERICLRVNTQRISAAEAASRLPCCKPGTYMSDILFVPSLDRTVREGIEGGLWFVQDEASRLCTVVLGAKAGEVIADVCSAPGGKSFSMAIDAEGRADIHSFDLHKNKLSLIKASAERLGLACIAVEERDARHPKEELIGICDRVLCDAPCSGLGVLGKKPDIRYKGGDCVGRLPEIQYGVLCGASAYVKDGGVLVYSTCTLNKSENEDVVCRFLESHGEFSAVDFSVEPLSEGTSLKSENGMLTLMPHLTGTDGFFVAKMIKNS